jgi:NADH-quinone oxidoreductase subunit L
MLLVVTGVGGLIHLFSVGYMSADPGYARFFSYLNLFVVFMLVLVLGSSFPVMFIGWEGVGLCSYLLIGFWFTDKVNADAGKKAFIVNRIGDFGFLIAMFLLWNTLGTLNFVQVAERAPAAFPVGGAAVTLITLFLFLGCVGKSAQIPLYVWLPDAMAGPTPVSALIHAATMVTAGVYLVVRASALFSLAPATGTIVAGIGALTALFAATIGLRQYDIKRVLAYSTVSQLGYMFVGVGAGAYAAGMFHLVTHSFFKALLFLGSGSVIHAMHAAYHATHAHEDAQDMRNMGGLAPRLPWTWALMWIATLAIAGIPPFSGFFSKDEILLLVGDRGGWHWALYVLGYIGAFLTAIYTWRMIFRAFFGEPSPEAQELAHGHLFHADQPRNPASGEVEDTDVGFPGPDHHIAEREGEMKVAMGLLAVLATVGGVLQIPKVTHGLDSFLDPTFADSTLKHTPSDGLIYFGLALGATVGLVGIAVAYRLWVVDPAAAVRWRERFAPVHRLFVNKWWFDELINGLVVRPFAWFGRFAQQTFERVFVNGTLVGGTTGAVKAGSAAVRALQSGFLRYYAGTIVLGMAALGVYFLIQSS